LDGILRDLRVIGPEVSTGGRYKHPAAIDALSSGDLYIVFHGGAGEYESGTAVYGLRRPKGEETWSPPERIASNPFQSLGNAVVWQAPDGIVWLFYVTRYGASWSTSRIHGKISRDGARTWSEPFVITFEAGTMVRSRPIVLASGDYLLPIYHEVGDDPEAVSAACTSLFLRFEPKTKSWSESTRIRSRLGNIQPAVVEAAPDRLIAFCRRGGGYEGKEDGYVVRSESVDGGRTWSAGVDSEFPNPNAAVDFLKLRSGHLLLVYNDSRNARTPLSAALSVDGGRSFPHRRRLVEGPGDFAYPMAVQTGDGRIHVVYTAEERTVIRVVAFEERALLAQ
jgi:predicted neuraminidase